MGFFANEPKTNVRPPSTDLIHRLECRVCPLNRITTNVHPHMPPSGAAKPLIYMLGEAPGAAEDKDGLNQFIGDSGQLLRARLPKNWLPEMRWNNVVRTRPPGNRTPEFIEVEACRPSVEKDIAATKPKAIFGFGAVPLQWVSGLTGIKEWRGRRMPVSIRGHQCWYYPMLHPAYLYRLKTEKRGRGSDKPSYIGSEDERAFCFDLKRALTEVRSLPQAVVHDAEIAGADVEIIEGYPGDLQKLEKLLAWAGAQPLVGVDYETNGLRPYKAGSNILSAAVGTWDRSFAFAIQHRRARWTAADLPKVIALWTKFLRSPARKAVHFLGFELEWTGVKFDKRLLRMSRWESTESQASVLDERTGKKKQRGGPLSLEFLVRQEFGFNLKAISNLDRANLDTEPLQSVLRYNAMDAKYHYALFLAQEQRLIAVGMIPQYEEMRRRVATCVLTQIKGVPVVQTVVEELWDKYQEVIDRTTKKIMANVSVERFEEQYKARFNPESPDDVVKLFRDMLKFKEGYGEDKKYSVDEETLTKIKHPLCPLILELRKARKKQSTYLYREVWPDKLLHPVFNTVFVETKRLCVAADTVLETNLGKVEIAKLDLDGAFKNAEIKTHRGRWRKITAKWFKGYERMVRLEFSNGGSIECTPGHRIFTGTDWEFAGSLKVNSRVAAAASDKKRYDTAGATPCVHQTRQNQASPSRGSLRIGGSVIWNDRNASQTILPSIGSIIHCVETVVVPPICSSGRPSETKELLQSSARQSARRETDAYCIVKRETRKVSGSRGCQNADRGGVADVSVFCGKEPSVTQTESSYRNASPIYGLHGTRPCDIRLSFPRSNKTTSSADLYAGSGHCRKDSICCLPTTSYPLGEGTQNDVWRDKWKTFPRDLLVEEHGRGTPNRAFNLSKHSALQAVDSPEETFEGLGLLLAKTSGGDRGRRCTSSRPNGNRKRYSERTTSSETWDFSLPDIRSTSEAGPGTYGSAYSAFTTVTKIKDAGVQAVWDITVDEDHSYVSQGVIHHNSCDGPNLQNIPKRDEGAKEVRRQIQAPEGHTIVSIDYGQIQARGIAMTSRDKAFCKALWERYDVHGAWAERISRAYPSRVGGRQNYTDKKVMKAFRGDIKNQWTFPLFFGAQLKGVSDYLQIPEDVLKPEFRAFQKEFSGVFEWHERLMDFYHEHGYVQDLTGVRRHGPLSKNQVINSPIQILEGVMVMDGMNRLSEYADKTSDDYYQPNIQIHDDLTYIWPSDKIDHYAEKTITEMLDMPFDFINVPITLELSIGQDMMGMTEMLVASSDDWKIAA